MKRTIEPMLFSVAGQDEVKEPLHYTLCGLDNVYLVNGFTREVVDGEEYIAVDHVEGLHLMIALRLAVLLRPLQPKEVRFLRKYLGITQEELGKLFGVSRKSVVDYERDLPLSRTSQIVLQLKVCRVFLDEARAHLQAGTVVPSNLRSNIDSLEIWLRNVVCELQDWLTRIPESSEVSDAPPAFIIDAVVGQWRIEAGRC